MGVINIPQPEYGMSIEDLIDIVARQSKITEFLVNGRIDSDNVREIAGFNVSQTTLKHKSGIVGLSGADPRNPNAIRFWAGSADPTTAPFRVTQAGIMTAVGALIQSANGYPRIEINGTNNALTAYKAAASYLAINPNLSSSVPGIEFVLSTVSASMYLFNPTGTPELYINTPVGQANIDLSSGLDLLLNPSGNLRINGNIGYTGSFSVVTSVTFGPTGGGSYTSKTITVNKGIVTSVG